MNGFSDAVDRKRGEIHRHLYNDGDFEGTIVFPMYDDAAALNADQVVAHRDFFRTAANIGTTLRMAGEAATAFNPVEARAGHSRKQDRRHRSELERQRLADDAKLNALPVCGLLAGRSQRKTAPRDPDFWIVGRISGSNWTRPTRTTPKSRTWPSG